MQSQPRHYPRRVNRDGTIDSICLRCFCTIASSKSEVTLSLAESQHQCSADSPANRANTPCALSHARLS